jgi:hypothetical protein
MKTQGTNLYAIDPANGQLLEVDCPTSIDGIDTSLPQIDTTCLNSAAREYVAGLAEPGTATFGINVDPKNPSHARLHQLKIAGTTLQWAVGLSEAPDVAPTVETDSDGEYAFVPNPARSWIFFEGFMNSFPFSFALNDVVKSTVGIQVSGEPELIPAGS